MKQDNSSNILTDNDVIALFAAFPDLKQLLPEDAEDAGKNAIMSLMDKKAKECGAEHGGQQILEHLAVVAAMKLRAKVALGELKKEDLAYFGTEFQNHIINKVNPQENKANETTPSSEEPEFAVNKGTCKEIRDMAFTTAVSLFPSHKKISQYCNKQLEENRTLLVEENGYRFYCLSLLSGNETASGHKLSEGEFADTIGRRLDIDSCPVESGDNNDIFKAFAALYQTHHTLLTEASCSVGYNFPKSFDLQNADNIAMIKNYPAAAIFTATKFRLEDNKHDWMQFLEVVNMPLTQDTAFDIIGVGEAYVKTDLLKGDSKINIDKLQKSSQNKKKQEIGYSIKAGRTLIERA